MVVAKEVAKLITQSIMGQDYRESKESKVIRFWGRIKKCLRG